MTTHELAKQLMELPDVPVGIEGWIPMKGYETSAKLCAYDHSEAIIVQECVDPKVEKEHREYMEKNFQWIWQNSGPKVELKL